MQNNKVQVKCSLNTPLQNIVGDVCKDNLDFFLFPEVDNIYSPYIQSWLVKVPTLQCKGYTFMLRVY